MTTIPQLYEAFLQCSGVTIDTRNIQPGQLFIALKGPNFNGNSFATKALEAGARYVLIDEPECQINEQTLLVPNALEALQQLGLHHRRQLHIPVLAITGSNGKTTTKELVHAVLATQFKTYTTKGNLNNHIGVPLTLLSIKADAEMAVIEMGANHQKEIAAYCSYTEPTHGLITNCGKAHLEGFGGVEGVRKGKGELFDWLRNHNGVAFICDDFDYFHTMSAGLQEIHWYGTNNGEVVGKVLASEPFLQVAIEKGLNTSVINTQLVGSYNVYNVLVAATVGKYFGISDANIVHAIEAYTPTNSRSQLIEKNGNKIILDAYNANPTSMVAAIENFAKLQAENKMLFLGGMMELGEESEQEHAQLIALIQQHQWKDVILVGGDFAKLPHPFRFFTNSSEAANWWNAQQSAGNYLLVKGSRSMQMEKIVG